MPAFSPVRVLEELEYMKQKFGSKGIYFIDDNFTINKKRTSEICRLMKERKLDIEWACDTRVDLLSEELLKEMYEAGCRTIFLEYNQAPTHLEKLNTTQPPKKSRQPLSSAEKHT